MKLICWGLIINLDHFKAIQQLTDGFKSGQSALSHPDSFQVVWTVSLMVFKPTEQRKQLNNIMDFELTICSSNRMADDLLHGPGLNYKPLLLKIPVLQLLCNSMLTTSLVVDTQSEGSNCGSTMLARASSKEQLTLAQATRMCICLGFGMVLRIDSIVNVA